MFRALLQTKPDFSLLLLRVALGASLLPHGLAKLGILVDGAPPLSEQIEKTVSSMGQTFGLDPIWVYLLIAAEILAPLALILGLLGRLAGLVTAGVMGTAAFMVMKLKAGGAELIDLPHVKWWWFDAAPSDGSMGGYHILAVAIGLTLLFRGSGLLSLDRAFSKP